MQNHPFAPSAPEPPSLEEPTLDSLAAQLFDHVEGQITYADTKAQLTLAANAILAATLSLVGRGEGLALFRSGVSPIDRIAGVMGLLMFVALLCSVYFALRVARPRMQAAPGSQGNLYFFGHIAAQPHDTYIDRFLAQSPDEARRGLLSQIYAKAKIAQQKFLGMRLSLDFLVGALVLWALTSTLLAFAP